MKIKHQILVILKNNCNPLAPSIKADSSNSLGIPSNVVLNNNKLNTLDKDINIIPKIFKLLMLVWSLLDKKLFIPSEIYEFKIP